jgi:hypothetical protein
VVDEFVCVCVCVCSIGGMIVTGDNRSAEILRRKPCISALFSQQIALGPTWNRTLALFLESHETYINK